MVSSPANSPMAESLAEGRSSARPLAEREAVPSSGFASPAAHNDHAASPRSQFLPVVEKFISVNGEGLAAGQLAAFIRFAGCNLWCSYCDTRWANHPLVEVEGWSVANLAQWVRDSEVRCVTLTGGEPLLQPHLSALVEALLAQEDPHPLRVEIETNGSRDLRPLEELRRQAARKRLPGQLCFTVDWKTPGAGSEVSAAMDCGNYLLLDKRDAVKFVVASLEDLQFARDRCRDLGLFESTNVLLSPVWGQIEPAAIVGFMQENNLGQARLQLQMHKIIWPGVEKGV